MYYINEFEILKNNYYIPVINVDHNNNEIEIKIKKITPDNFINDKFNKNILKESLKEKFNNYFYGYFELKTYFKVNEEIITLIYYNEINDYYKNRFGNKLFFNKNDLDCLIDYIFNVYDLKEFEVKKYKTLEFKDSSNNFINIKEKINYSVYLLKK